MPSSALLASEPSSTAGLGPGIGSQALSSRGPTPPVSVRSVSHPCSPTCSPLVAQLRHASPPIGSEALMRKVRSIRRGKMVWLKWMLKLGCEGRTREMNWLERGRGRGDWPTAALGRDPRRNDDRKRARKPGESIGWGPRCGKKALVKSSLGEASRRLGVAESAALEAQSSRPCPTPNSGFGSGPRAHTHCVMATSASHSSAKV